MCFGAVGEQTWLVMPDGALVAEAASSPTILFMSLYTLALAVPVTGIKAALANIFRWAQFGRQWPRLTILCVGGLMPVVMVLRGLWLAWPWPWSQPEVVEDMIPGGRGCWKPRCQRWCRVCSQASKY